MNPLRRLAFPACCLILAACQAPFVDSSRQEVAAGRVAICYSSQGTTPAEIVDLARRTCAEQEKAAVFIGQQRYQCRLFAPHRAVYRCQ